MLNCELLSLDATFTEYLLALNHSLYVVYLSYLRTVYCIIDTLYVYTLVYGFKSYARLLVRDILNTPLKSDLLAQLGRLVLHVVIF